MCCSFCSFLPNPPPSLPPPHHPPQSKYNGIDPTTIVADYGADTARLFVLFKAPPDAVLDWDMEAVQGVSRWLRRVWSLATDWGSSAAAPRSTPQSDEPSASRELRRATHTAIKNVTIAMRFVQGVVGHCYVVQCVPQPPPPVRNIRNTATRTASMLPCRSS